MGGILDHIRLGKEDKEGSIDATQLIDIIKNEFEMSIDIEKLI